MTTPAPDPIRSLRPDLTAELSERTGLDEAMLDRVVRAFYGRIRADAMLGPIFDERIEEWEPHLRRMTAFWSSVALMTGSYHGRPLEKHLPLPVEKPHFARWLALFEETAREICPPEGAEHLVERAHRIARSIEMAVEDARGTGGPPRLVP
jgi:hemoglobin